MLKSSLNKKKKNFISMPAGQQAYSFLTDFPFDYQIPKIHITQTVQGDV